jgi:hypothetical protein
MGEVTSAEVLLIACDVIEVVVAAASKADAVTAALGRVAELDEGTARRVAAAVAVELNWSVRGRSARATRMWLDRMRLEATWEAS